jgi:8-oxo-dGTP pyrophosphatase MutT (NUDIX family)
MAGFPLGDRFGNQLVSIQFAAESELGVLVDPAATPLSLIVVICASEVLMVLDRRRGQWELPGGMREQGESARQAAARELAEETASPPGSWASPRWPGSPWRSRRAGSSRPSTARSWPPRRSSSSMRKSRISGGGIRDRRC